MKMELCPDEDKTFFLKCNVTLVGTVGFVSPEPKPRTMCSSRTLCSGISQPRLDLLKAGAEKALHPDKQISLDSQSGSSPDFNQRARHPSRKSCHTYALVHWQLCITDNQFLALRLYKTNPAIYSVSAAGSVPVIYELKTYKQYTKPDPECSPGPLS